MTLLAIESSCDDTAAAVCTDGVLRSNVVSSQKEHAQWGGVIPELASRRHMTNIVPVVEQALANAGCTFGDIEAIACTSGPGLIGSLLVGHTFARSLALAHGLPFIEVDHMEGHISSLFVAEPKPAFPFLCLTVSGGHTQIARVTDPLTAEVLGRTLDDAAGEAFDKAAKLLGFDYPGGPLLDKTSLGGDIHFLPLPEPRVDGLDFSFSGLKTALLYSLRKKQAEDPQFIQRHLADICASVQHRIVTALLDKLFQAAHETGIHELGIVGGVSANSYLRAQFMGRCEAEQCTGYIPAFAYCTDNAAMIAIAAYHKWQAGQTSALSAVPYASR
jgi:N6-L-threonylcarbamoyladenine synthase